MEIVEYEGYKVPVGNHKGKKIILGCDHRGYDLKQKLKIFLVSHGYKIVDVGCQSSERCDYPVYSRAVGKLVHEDEACNTVGIGICGSGIGMSIPASKFRGVYPGLCVNIDQAKSTRKHNNTNYLSLPADQLDFEKARQIVEAWLEEPFFSTKDEEPYLKRFVQTLKVEEEVY